MEKLPAREFLASHRCLICSFDLNLHLCLPASLLVKFNYCWQGFLSSLCSPPAAVLLFLSGLAALQQATFVHSLRVSNSQKAIANLHVHLSQFRKNSLFGTWLSIWHQLCSLMALIVRYLLKACYLIKKSSVPGSWYRGEQDRQNSHLLVGNRFGWK